MNSETKKISTVTLPGVDLRKAALSMPDNGDDFHKLVNKMIRIAKQTGENVRYVFNGAQLVVDKSCTQQAMYEAYMSHMAAERVKQVIKDFDDDKRELPAVKQLIYPNAFAYETNKNPQAGMVAKKVANYLQMSMETEYDTYFHTYKNATEEGLLQKEVLDVCRDHINHSSYSTDDIIKGYQILIGTWKYGERVADLMGYKPEYAKSLRQKSAYLEEQLEKTAQRMFGMHLHRGRA